MSNMKTLSSSAIKFFHYPEKKFYNEFFFYGEAEGEDEGFLIKY